MQNYNLTTLKSTHITTPFKSFQKARKQGVKLFLGSGTDCSISQDLWLERGRGEKTKKRRGWKKLVRWGKEKEGKRGEKRERKGGERGREGGGRAGGREEKEEER